MAQSVIGALRVNLGLDSAQFNEGLSAARARLASFGRRMQVVGAGITAVGAGIATAVAVQTNRMADIGRMAAVANTSAEQFQRFAVAASTVNIEADKMADILKDVSDRVGDFITTGGGPMADFFENIAPKVGITAEAFKDLSGADALQLYVSSLEKAGVSQNEMTFYLEAMASDASALAPLLANNGAELNRLGDAAERAGAIFSQDAADGARQFLESANQIKTSLGGLVTQITTALLPTMQKIADFAVMVSEKFSNLSPEMQTFIAAVAGITVVVGPLVIALGLLLSAIAVISAPVLAVVAAVALLTAGFIAFYPEIMAAKDAIVTFARDGIETVKAKFAELVEFVKTIPAQMLEIGQNIVQGFADGILQKWESVKGSVTGVFTSVGDSVKGLFRIRSPSRLMYEYGEYISEGLALGIEAGATDPISALQNVAVGMKDQLLEAITSANSFGEAMRNIGSVVRNTLSQMASDFLSSGLNSLVGGILGGIGIPGFASGTNSAPGGLARVNERGGELINLPRGSQVIPHGMSKQMMRQQPANITQNIIVTGATGNSEVRQMVAQGVQQGNAQIRREVPGIVQQHTKVAG